MKIDAPVPQATPPPVRRAARRARRPQVVILVLLATVAMVFGMAACSGLGPPDTGDCVEKNDDSSYSEVDCAGAQLRVLERQDLDGDCTTVAGVTEGYTDFDGDYQLCVGPRDTDPATAINVAAVGDCFSDIQAQDVHRLDCTDPSAEYQVLSRDEDSFDTGLGCSETPGTTSSYSWDLQETGDAPLASVNNMTRDIVFCLGPAGVDPQSSPDTAQVGDCLRETAEDPGWAKVDCSAPEATYQVVERVDNAFLTVEVACASAEGATSGIEQDGGNGLSGYVLCLAPR